MVVCRASGTTLEMPAVRQYGRESNASTGHQEKAQLLVFQAGLDGEDLPVAICLH